MISQLWVDMISGQFFIVNSLIVGMNKNLLSVDLTLLGDDRPKFVLADRDGVLIGRMFLQEKRIIYSPGLVISFLVLEPDL